MELGEAFDLISAAIAADRLANGYLVTGDAKGNALELVERVLAVLFPGQAGKPAGGDGPDRIWSHPDVFRLDPQGRSRTIKVARGESDAGPGMRDGIVEPVSRSAFSGGWKAGVVFGADRLQPAAANAFLKSLEEPPPKTVFFLLTDQPDMILPTIVSRCQRIDLPLPPGLLGEGDYEAVAEVFESRGVEGVFEKAQAARHLAGVLAALVDAAEDEDVALVRKAFFRTVLSFVRRWMVEGLVPRHRAFANVEAVERAYARCCQYLPAEPVIADMMDRIAFP